MWPVGGHRAGHRGTGRHSGFSQPSALVVPEGESARVNRSSRYRSPLRFQRQSWIVPFTLSNASRRRSSPERHRLERVAIRFARFVGSSWEPVGERHVGGVGVSRRERHMVVATVSSVRGLLSPAYPDGNVPTYHDYVSIAMARRIQLNCMSLYDSCVFEICLYVRIMSTIERVLGEPSRTATRSLPVPRSRARYELAGFRFVEKSPDVPQRVLDAVRLPEDVPSESGRPLRRVDVRSLRRLAKQREELATVLARQPHGSA